MTTKEDTKSIQRTARLAGFLYLLLLPLGIFGLLYVPIAFVVPGDATATATNIANSISVYRLSILTALLIQIVNISVVLTLYQLLKSVNKYMASLMVIFIFLAAPIAMLSEINQFAVLALLNGTDHLAVFNTAQLQALVVFFLDMHDYGVSIASIFWGFWLFPMGYLVFKSGFLPKFLGILLMIGCFGYLIDFFAPFFFPNLEITVSQFTFIGELLFPLWLLIKGVNVEMWQKRALEFV
ncbi:MAG: DUF4386 domain-containing protein [Anaerolineales bacterium]|nr:DUF4386 domain-containing protein [Anaerolineales bacterium]